MKKNIKFIPKNKNLEIDFNKLKRFLSFKYAGKTKEPKDSTFIMQFKNTSFLIRDNGELEFHNVNFKDIYFVLYFRYWIARNLKGLNDKFAFKFIPKKLKKEEMDCQEQ
jgi:hypothetical protein